MTSLEFSRNVTIAQLKNDVLSSNKAILSVRDGRLLAGQKGDTKLFIYSAVSGAYMNTTRLPFTYPGNTVYDAVWTRNGNIVYTTRENGSKVNTVEVMALNGTLIRSTNLSRPRYLSVSANGIIYLADANNGVYQSADNGVTWYHKFSIDSTRYGYQTVNVQNSRSATDEFWIVAYHSSNRWYYWYLDVYTDNGDYIASTPNYRSLSTIKDPSFSKFAHDGHETMFLLDYINGTVHALSTVTRAYDRPLLTSRHFTNNYPVSLSVDVTRDNNVLYVGLSKYGLVSVYTLQYR